jgi:hypothetical protein
MSGPSSPTSSAAASRGKPGSAPSAPTVPTAGCRRRIGCTPRREGSGTPPDDVSRRRLRQGPHAGRGGSRIPGTLLAAAATGRCSCGIGRPRSNRLPASTKSHRHRRLGEVQPRQNPRRRRLGEVRAAMGRGHSLGSCCPGSADLRGRPTGQNFPALAGLWCERRRPGKRRPLRGRL